MDKTDKISYREYLFLVINHILGFVIVLSFTDSTAKQDSWLVIIAAFIASVPFVLVYAGLAKRFPSKTLQEVFQTVFGRIAGTIISILYIILYLIVLGYYLEDLSEFFTGFFQPETSPAVFTVTAVLVAVYGLKKGIHYLAKMSVLFTVLSIAFISSNFALLIDKMDFSNLLPVLRQPAGVYLRAVPQFVMVPCCQMLYLRLLPPKLKSTRKLPKYSVRVWRSVSFSF
jgi:spore germination protein KB